MVDGYRSGECVFGGNNVACQFPLNFSVFGTLVACGCCILCWKKEKFDHSDNAAVRFILSIVSLCMSITWLASFGYTTHLWNPKWPEDHFHVTGRAILAFEFFSFFAWVRSVIFHVLK